MRWIIGDIHGMLRPLEALIAAVHQQDTSPQFLFVGDYVNRGPDSHGVIDLLLALPNARFARGNHDDVLDLVLNGTSYAVECTGSDPAIAFQWFMQFGLSQTLQSYGADAAELKEIAQRPSLQRIAAVCSAVPQAHREFIAQLPPVIEEPDLFVAHALWPPELGTDEPSISVRLVSERKLREGILWGRFSIANLRAEKAWNRTGYFGHTPVEAYTASERYMPVSGNKIVLLDTAAALAQMGRLTACCAETGRYIQVDRSGAVVKRDGEIMPSPM